MVVAKAIDPGVITQEPEKPTAIAVDLETPGAIQINLNVSTPNTVAAPVVNVEAAQHFGTDRICDVLAVRVEGFNIQLDPSENYALNLGQFGSPSFVQSGNRQIRLWPESVRENIDAVGGVTNREITFRTSEPLPNTPAVRLQINEALEGHVRWMVNQQALQSGWMQPTTGGTTTVKVNIRNDYGWYPYTATGASWITNSGSSDNLWITNTATANNYGWHPPITNYNGFNTGWTDGFGASGFRCAETPEQTASRVESEKKHRQARQAAEVRAEGLLRRYLSEEQQHELDKHNYFTVRSQSGQLFQINRGRAGNVYRLDGLTRKPVERFCIHPVEYVPDSDTMLSQKIMLEIDEASFVKTANRTKLAA